MTCATTFGQEIKNALKVKELDIEDVYQDLDIKEFETGKEFLDATCNGTYIPSLYQVMCICRALNINPWETFKLVYFDNSGITLHAEKNTKAKRDLACSLAVRWNNLSAAEIKQIASILVNKNVKNILEDE